MTIAVMQPYLFPYIGYFQMIQAVDKFVFYDDVNFIKQGWINRNKILTNQGEYLFTVPLNKATSFHKINETFIYEKLYESWKHKFLRTLEQEYKKAPHFVEIYDLVAKVFREDYKLISDLAINSVRIVSDYLGLNTSFIIASEKYDNKNLGREERLIDICHIEGANHYINAEGGMELYSADTFEKNGIKLKFIKSHSLVYKQFKEPFVPSLSIIDVMMFLPKEEIQNQLNCYALIEPIS